MQSEAFHNNVIFRILWPPIFGALAYLLILLLNNNLDDLSSSYFTQEFLFTVILTFGVFEINRLFINLSHKINITSISGRITFILNIALILTTICVFVLVTLYFKLILNYSSMGSFSRELTIFLFIFPAASLVYTALVIANQFLYQENENLIQHEKILSENLELELVKYQNDVNPELFYDSLESLISLLHKDPFDAEDYIDRLAMVYRHILSNKNAELTSLKEELTACNNIVVLLNEKYNHLISLKSSLNEEEIQSILVIPGSITNIVESIIRNSIITPVLPLAIELEEESDDYFTIRHKLNERLQSTSDNRFYDIQKAYSIFEKPIVTVKAYGEQFVKIPILRMEKSTQSSEVL